MGNVLCNVAFWLALALHLLLLYMTMPGPASTTCYCTIGGR